MDEKARIEVELALKTMLSSSVKQMTADFDAWTKKLVDSGGSGTAGIAAYSKEVLGLGEKAKQTSAPLTNIANTLFLMSKSFIGPAVFGASVAVSATVAMKRFTESLNDLKRMATDTGFTEAEIIRSGRAATYMGQTEDQGREILAQYGEGFNTILREGSAAPWLQELRKMPAAGGVGRGGAGIAEGLQGRVRRGDDRQETVAWIAAEYARLGQNPNVEEGRRAQLNFARIFPGGETWLRQYPQAYAKAPAYEAPPDVRARLEAMREWMTRKWQATKNQFEQIYYGNLGSGGALNALVGGPAMWLLEWEQHQKKTNYLEDIKKALEEMLGMGGMSPDGRAGLRAGIGGFRRGGGRMGVSNGVGEYDLSGKAVDPSTLKSLQILGARGDTRGMQSLMASRGYRVDNFWCGDVAHAISSAAGFPSPKGYATASNWRLIGGQIDPRQINVGNKMFGSLYAVKQGVPIGQGGGSGHVMEIYPESYDPSNNSIEVLDTGGRHRRSLSGYDVFWQGSTAEAAAREAQSKGTAPPSSARPAGGSALAEPDAPPVRSVRIGVTQNNPLNLKYTGSEWQLKNLPGLRPGTTFDEGDRQAAFNSPQAGWNAGALLALRKFNEGKNTVQAMIAGPSGWTPGYTPAANAVAGMMGVRPNEPLNFNDPNILANFLDALEIQEQGTRYYPKAMAVNAANKAVSAARGSIDAAKPEDVPSEPVRLHVNVGFKNAPAWLKTVVDHDDSFEKVSVTKTVNPETMN